MSHNKQVTMKKSVSTLICNLSIIFTAFVLLCLCSCAGILQKTGSVSFVIGPELLNAARDGGTDDNREYVRVVVALEGKDYGIKQTVDIPLATYMSSIETDKRFEANFDNIPVGKKLYAVIKTYQMMPGNNLPLEIRDPDLYGKSDYFTVKAGNNTIGIKASTNYRDLVPYSYNDTPLVLYDYKSSVYEYNLDGLCFSATQKGFCFDCNGNFYTINSNGGSYSILPSFPSLEIYSSVPPSIVVDSKTNIMYSYYFYAGDVYITKYPELISSNISENKEEKKIESLVVTIDGGPTYACYPKSCTINNGIVYIIASYSEDGVYLFTVPFENISLIAKEKIEIPTGEIKDIIYMDGAIYFLVNHRDNSLSSSCTETPYDYYSRGALIKYNISDGSIKTLGWTSDALNNSGKCLYIKAGAGIKVRILYENYDCTIPFKICADNLEGKLIEEQQILFPSFYVSEGLNNTNQFYGPQKFIAVKPKKLIIADDGVAFYTDSNNAYNTKNVNRIVTVDLESFAITSVVNTGSIFDSEQSVDIITSAFGNVSTFMGSGTYYEGEGGVEFSSSETAPLYAFIPLDN